MYSDCPWIIVPVNQTTHMKESNDGNENKNGNFSRRVAFLKKPLPQQFLAFKCSKLSQNFPLKEITGRLSNVKV